MNSEQSEFDDLMKSLSLDSESKTQNDLNLTGDCKREIENCAKQSEIEEKQFSFVDKSDINLLINVKNKETINYSNNEKTISCENQNEIIVSDLLENVDNSVCKEEINSNKMALILNEDILSTLDEDSVECFYDTNETANSDEPGKEKQSQQRESSSVSLSFQSTNEFTELVNEKPSHIENNLFQEETCLNNKGNLTFWKKRYHLNKCEVIKPIIEIFR